MNQREIHIERKDKSMFNRGYLFSAEGAVFTQSLGHRPRRRSIRDRSRLDYQNKFAKVD